MGDFTNLLENAILDHIFDQATYATPDLYVGLHTGNPGEFGGFELPFSGGYARVYTFFMDWTPAGSGRVDNFNTIVFPMATDYWGWVTYFGLFNAAFGGNLLIYGTLTPSEEVMFGDVVKFLPFALTVTLD